MFKKGLALLLLSASLLVGCGGKKEEKLPGPDDVDDKENGEITVNFYADYNQKIAKNIYSTQKWDFGDKVVKIAGPSTPNDPAFPNFIGWSLKEVIDDKKDLYDFSKPLTEDIVDHTNTLELFGIWFAEGEK